MTMDREALERWMEASAAVAGLPIEPMWRDGVLLNLERLAAMAALLADANEVEGAEPAPRFDPSGP